MSHLLCHTLLLIFLSDRNVFLVKSSNYEVECGEDTGCKRMAKLVAGVNEIQNKLDKLDKQTLDLNVKLDVQAKNMEELKMRLNKTAISTKDISTQLERHSADLLSYDRRLQAHEVTQRNACICGTYHRPKDCSDIRLKGCNVSGIYRVYLGNVDTRIETDVYCEFPSSKDSWLVFQRRKDGSVNFERTWKEYENGFGNLDGEFWLGNEKLSLLTMNRKYKLRVELEDFDGEKRYAEYSNFSVNPAADKYRLDVGGYSGNAGDSLAFQNGMQFSTKDADNDVDSRNCAQVYHGAWWYQNCHYSNLNGLYLRGAHTSIADGVNWYHWRGHFYSHKITEMKIAAIF